MPDRDAPRPRLTPEAITEAAICIADAKGLDAVSMRRVASALNVRAMSLYTHFASKDDLLISMTDSVVEEMLVQDPLPEDWRQAVATIARHRYRGFVVHPWVVLLFTRVARFGPAATRAAKQAARSMASLSLEPGEMWTLQGLVSDYVVGYSLRAVNPAAGTDLARAIPKSDVVEFPELASLRGNLEGRTSEDRFELGLQIVLDGIESRLAGPRP